MSSIIVLRQRSSVHLMCDAAAYFVPSGILHSVDLKKCHPIAGMSAALACTGPAMLGSFLADEISQGVKSFDDLVDRFAEIVPPLFERYADEMRRGDAFSTFYLVGWHEAKQRPAAYSAELFTASSTRLAGVVANDPNHNMPTRYQLEETVVACTPMPPQELLEEGGFILPDDENDMSAEIDLLHLMEIQRRELVEDAHWVGGNALLTSIDRRGVIQRIVHHWPEDVAGEVITPLPIDWPAWKAARRETSPIPMMSRLKRQMQERKAKRRIVA